MKKLSSTKSLAAIAVVVGAFCLIASSALAENPSIVGSINNNDLVTVSGTSQANLPGFIDNGPVAENTAMTTMIVLKQFPNPTITQEQYNNDLSDRSSPYFHQFLTGDQEGSMFGISNQDIQAITNWLQGYGIKVVSVMNTRTSMSVSGTAAQFESAFHIQLDNFYNSQQKINFIASKNDTKIPSALKDVMTGPLFGASGMAMAEGQSNSIGSSVPTQPNAQTVNGNQNTNSNSNVVVKVGFWQKIANFFKSLFRL